MPLALHSGPPDKIAQGRRPQGPSFAPPPMTFRETPLLFRHLLDLIALRTRPFRSVRPDNVHKRKTRSVACRGRSALESELLLDEDHSPQVDPEVWSESR